MTSMYCAAQFWTDPLKAKLKNTPWTFEFWPFYVKFRDLPGWESSADGLGRDLIQMIEVGEDLAPNARGAASLPWYDEVGSQAFLASGAGRIVECYFREDGQASNIALGPAPEQYMLAHVFAGQRKTVMERLTTAAVEDRRINMPGHVGGEMYAAMMDYAAMRNQSVAELQAMDYEDIVRSAGGRAVVRDVDRDQLHVPELLGMIRHWDYPVNTVEPSTGVPAVAFGHRFAQKLRQNFRFPEFGWVMCFACWRPKVFYRNQRASFASMMNTRQHWFMASDDPNADSHWMTIPDNVGPLKNLMDTPNTPYTIDLRNLLWHGEQFVNYDLTGADAEGIVSMPDAAGNRDYPAVGDLDAVFATTGGRIRMNGVMDVSIKTYQATNPNLTQDDRQFSNRD